MTSFDLVSDNNGSVQWTFDSADFDAAIVAAINHLGFQVQSKDSQNEHDLFEYQIINTATGEVEHEFVTYSQDAAHIEALTSLGHSLFETLTEAELNVNNSLDDDDEEAEAMIANYEEVEYGKIVAFSGNF